MKKTILFIMLALLLALPLVHADLTTGLQAVLRFENSSCIEEINHYSTNCTGVNINTTGGIQGNYAWSNGVDVNVTIDPSFLNDLGNSATNSYTICWRENPDKNNNEAPMGWITDSTNYGQWGDNGDNSLTQANKVSGTFAIYKNSTADGKRQKDSWNSVCQVWNHTNSKLIFYVNSSVVYGQMSTGSFINTPMNRLAGGLNRVCLLTNTISGGQCNSNSYDGALDEIYLWSRALTAAEVTTLESDFYPFTGGVSDSLNISSPLPADNTQYDFSTLNFNLTANATYPFNCTLYINGTANQTRNSFSPGTDVFVNFNETFNDGTYNFNVQCVDGNVTETSTNHTFYIDTINPTILSTNFTNLSTFVNRNITGQFNFSDDQVLYSYNISIDGTQIDGDINLSVASYWYNLSHNISTLASGSHILTVRFADGHTRNQLKSSYGISSGKTLKYDLPEGYWVKIKSTSNDNNDLFKTEKKIDRYEFSYQPETIKDTYSFEIESNKDIDIISASWTPWEKWLVIGEHWLDFYQPEENNQILIYEKIGKNKVKVTVSGLENKDMLKFSSIGDLNIVEKNYTFYTTNTTITYSSSVSELQSQTILLQINLTDSITSTAATLLWNGTNQSVIKTSTASYDLYNATFITPKISGVNTTINFTWGYEIITNITNETGNITNNQTIYSIQIDNCSVSTFRAINFTIINESSDLPITGTLSGYFTAWIDNSSNAKNFNISWAAASGPDLCINPQTAQYQINAQMEYEATGFTKRTYYINNLTINNDTQLIPLYLSNETTLYTFTVTDQNDNPVQDAYIHILAYDITTDSSKVTEIIKTDNLGQAFGNIIVNTQRYKFLIYYNNTLYLETVDTVLTGTSRGFRINFQTDYFAKYDNVLDVSCKITFTNSTKIFSYTYADPNGNLTQACLKVTKSTINGETTINETCLNAVSGTININIGNVTGTADYTGTGSITLKGNQFICGEPVTFTYNYRYLQFGLTGILLGFFLIVAMVMIFIWDTRVGVVASLFVMVMINILGFYKLNWPALVGLLIIGGIFIYRYKKT